jgi:hypothetical protein
LVWVLVRILIWVLVLIVVGIVVLISVTQAIKKAFFKFEKKGEVKNH